MRTVLGQNEGESGQEHQNGPPGSQVGQIRHQRWASGTPSAFHHWLPWAVYSPASALLCCASCLNAADGVGGCPLTPLEVAEGKRLPLGPSQEPMPQG